MFIALIVLAIMVLMFLSAAIVAGMETSGFSSGFKGFIEAVIGFGIVGGCLFGIFYLLLVVVPTLR